MFLLQERETVNRISLASSPNTCLYALIAPVKSLKLGGYTRKYKLLQSLNYYRLLGDKLPLRVKHGQYRYNISKAKELSMKAHHSIAEHKSAFQYQNHAA